MLQICLKDFSTEIFTAYILVFNAKQYRLMILELNSQTNKIHKFINHTNLETCTFKNDFRKRYNKHFQILTRSFQIFVARNIKYIFDVENSIALF